MLHETTEDASAEKFHHIYGHIVLCMRHLKMKVNHRYAKKEELHAFDSIAAHFFFFFFSFTQPTNDEFR